MTTKSPTAPPRPTRRCRKAYVSVDDQIQPAIDLVRKEMEHSVPGVDYTDSNVIRYALCRLLKEATALIEKESSHV